MVAGQLLREMGTFADKYYLLGFAGFWWVHSFVSLKEHQVNKQAHWRTRTFVGHMVIQVFRKKIYPPYLWNINNMNILNLFSKYSGLILVIFSVNFLFTTYNSLNTISILLAIIKLITENYCKCTQTTRILHHTLKNTLYCTVLLLE